MYYHPLIGITIFLVAIVLSFLLGNRLMKKRKNNMINLSELEQNQIPKGEITSPDAPWLKDNK